MKIFMTGGTGFIGTTLTERLTNMGHQVTLLTRTVRSGRSLPDGATFLEGNPVEQGMWQERVKDHEVIINLAGASIFTRWTKDAKKEMRESRIKTTNNLVEAISVPNTKVRLVVSTSAVGYYGFHGDEDLDEASPPGEDFLAQLAREWESSALRAREADVDVVLMRFGVVLGKKGGALGMMIPVFKKYLGSPLGSGKQWFSWIHEEDLANIHLFLLDQKRISGPVNCTAPTPVRNGALAKVLGEVLSKPTFMPAVPGFVIRMIMGEFGSVLLNGQRVLPKRLLSMGFRFRYPEIKKALQSVLGSVESM